MNILLTAKYAISGRVKHCIRNSVLPVEITSASLDIIPIHCSAKMYRMIAANSKKIVPAITVILNASLLGRIAWRRNS